VIESELAETKQRLSDLEEATLKHVNNVNSVVENEMTRFEKVISAVEKHQLNTMEENNRSIDEFRKELTRNNTVQEDGLTRRLDALEAQIKVVDSDLSKCTFDWRDRCDQIAADHKALEVTFNSQLASYKDMF
jgi:hypothetical protein